MPVALNVWQQVVSGSPACRARRLITPHRQTLPVGAGVASTSSRPKVPPLRQVGLTMPHYFRSRLIR
jgi:hypothetical protein